MAFPPLETFDHILINICFSLNFEGDAQQHLIIVVLIGMVLVIVYEMFSGRLYYDSTS